MEQRTLCSSIIIVGQPNNPDPYAPPQLTAPHDFTDLNGTVYFSNPANENGLWKTDGTPEGTTAVALPGQSLHNVENLLNVNGTLFFSAIDQAHGSELWRSDGTPGGTAMVADLKPGLAGSGPRELTNLNGTLFFFADDGTHGMQLWKSDGTPSGTSPVFTASPETSQDTFSGDLVNVNGTLLFFVAHYKPFDYAVQLWRSDGTPTGTSILADLGTANRRSADGITVVGNIAYFAFGEDQVELWRTDLTTTGTSRVANLDAPINGIFNPSGTVIVRTTQPGAALWQTDGTAQGTTKFADLPSYPSEDPTPAAPLGSALLYKANSAYGPELWRRDGTNASQLSDIILGPTGSDPSSFVAFNGAVYFAATDVSHGRELFVSDGTAAGTHLLADIKPGVPSADPWELKVIDGSLYFITDDGGLLFKLWRWDGQHLTLLTNRPGASLQNNQSLNAPTPPAAALGTYNFDVKYTLLEGGDNSSIIGNNTAVRVRGPNGFDQLATYVTIKPDPQTQQTTAPALIVTYQIQAPGGGWDSGDDGPYTFSIAPGAIHDTVTSVPAGTFATADLRVDTSPPTATLVPPEQPVSGSNSFHLMVNYDDDLAIAPLPRVTLTPPLSIIHSIPQIIVTTPAGYDWPQFATFSIDPANPGHISVTYTLSGTWDSDRNGTYTVRANPGGITDLAGNPVPDGVFGSFSVDLPAAPPSSGPSTPTAGDLSATVSVTQKGPPQNPRGTATVRVSNAGGQTVAGRFNLNLLLSSDDRLDDNDAILNGLPDRTARLKPHATKTFKVPIKVTDYQLPAGPHYVLAQIDPQSGLQDAKVSNNTAAALWVTVKPTSKHRP